MTIIGGSHENSVRKKRSVHVRIRKTSIKRQKRGFRHRMKTPAGRNIIRRRRRIGRKLPGHKKSRRG